MAKKKVAILGSGVGAMAAAFRLSDPELGGAYDLTVYQLGWRLGGKGASGRNPDVRDRIEEHGPHVWSGVYDNAFRMMREAYAELDRPPQSPLATWREAFQPLEGTMAMLEEFRGEWYPWISSPPSNDQLPGEPDAHLLLPFWSYVGEALRGLGPWLRSSHRGLHAARRRSAGALRGILLALLHGLAVAAIAAGTAAAYMVYLLARVVHRILEVAPLRPLRSLLHTLLHGLGGAFLGLLHVWTRAHWRRVRFHLNDPELRKNWIFLNFAVGLLRGLHRDDVVRRGFQSIDHLEFREWLGRHIVDDSAPGAPSRDCDPEASELSLTLNSPLALFLHHADFAYADGDLCRPRMSAGVAAYTLIRLAVTWKGALIWGMHAGMGDVVFAPLYQVLTRRGVKFEFFRKVKDLHLSPDSSSIEAVTVARQARVKAGPHAYEPLNEVKGLPTWPSHPDWDQLEDGDRYARKGVNFEAWYGPELDSYELRRGRDFDQVVLGISLGGVPYVCGELIEADERWRAMVEHVGTVRTRSLQLWLDETTWTLGWQQQGDPTVSCYDVSSFHEWADLSFLVPREGWSDGPAPRPRSIQYVTGPLEEDRDPRGRIQSPEELDQDAADRRVRRMAVDYLTRDVFRILKHAASDGTFQWERLVDHREPPMEGEGRIDAQYVRANVQPTERYVQSLPGSTRYRLHPGASGFENLFLAGDWTWNSFNSGCVEAAAISGLLVSHAICGRPALSEIVGLTFGHPDAPYAVER